MNHMDPRIYGAARAGQFDVLLLNYRAQFEVQVTPNNNTILHIAALFNKVQCVNEISTSCPLLLFKVNKNGETALHVAAKEGYYEVVKALIECSKRLDGDLESGAIANKDMLRMTNEDGDTALHEAVRGGHVVVVKMLIKEDPDFPHPCNKADETPLYLAVEKRLEDCVSEILKTCTSPSAVGPRGASALHAAVILHSPGSLNDLLNWKPSLSREADLNGWTPLHYAAHLGYVEGAKQLLESDSSLPYLIANKDDNNTALHVAASQGKTEVMELLISSCPDCIEIVNTKGQNVFHIAFENKKDVEINSFLDSPAFGNFPNNLIYQKDNNGNTPLHLVAASCRNLLKLRFLAKLVFESRPEFNNESMTPADIFKQSISTQEILMDTSIIRHIERCGHTGLRNLMRRDTDKRTTNDNNSQLVENDANDRQVVKYAKKRESNTSLIVATLIATVTFAAGFTLPGGYNDQGMAILTSKRGFQAFVITDTIAMMCSSCSVFIYFVEAVLRTYSLSLLNADFLHILANALLISAQATMMIAFFTGLFVVLEPPSCLSTVASVIGSVFIFLYYYLFDIMIGFKLTLDRFVILTKKIRLNMGTS